MRVLVPMPDHDADVTEVAVPWRRLTEAGHEVVFATEHGRHRPAADPRLLRGVLFGQLGAAPEPKAFYAAMQRDPAYRTPIAWGDVDVAAYDGLVLPGGHAPGMRQYLGSAALHEQVARFWALDRPVGAICHGVLVLARSADPATGRSVLRGRRTTSLTKWQERSAFYLTAWRLGRYYRTYPAYVEDEVRAALGPDGHYDRGPFGNRRDTADDDGPAFVVTDGRYVSARWPGDAHTFARAFVDVLEA